jgi:hypothetical protein
MKFTWESWKAAARSFLHCLKETTDRNAQAAQQAELATISWGVKDKSPLDIEWDSPDPSAAPRWLFVDTEQEPISTKEAR